MLNGERRMRGKQLMQKWGLCVLGEEVRKERRPCPCFGSGAPAHCQLSGTLASGVQDCKGGERRESEDKSGIEISVLRRVPSVQLCRFTVSEVQRHRA